MLLAAQYGGNGFTSVALKASLTSLDKTINTLKCRFQLFSPSICINIQCRIYCCFIKKKKKK